MIDKLINVNDHLENIVKNSGEHCHFCKIMNITQTGFKKRKFEEDLYQFENQSLQRTPEWLIKLGEVKLCHECYDDSGFDKQHENKDVTISSV
jgi:hypothetical protein